MRRFRVVLSVEVEDAGDEQVCEWLTDLLDNEVRCQTEDATVQLVSAIVTDTEEV